MPVMWLQLLGQPPKAFTCPYTLSRVFWRWGMVPPLPEEHLPLSLVLRSPKHPLSFSESRKRSQVNLGFSATFPLSLSTE